MMSAPAPQEGRPSLSVIIPVLHEASLLNEAIARIRTEEPEGAVEIIVVDGDGEGNTLRIVADPAVRCLTSERGRARQMNAGARAAAGDILLFLHADTILPHKAFSLIRGALSKGGAVAGAFDLGFSTRKKIFKITEVYVYLRTRLTRIPFGDQAIFIRRDCFESFGGYRDIPIMEDVDLMKRIRKQGGTVRIVPRKVLTSPRRYEKEGIVRCTLRNWMLQLLYALGVSPGRLVKWYRS